MLLNRRGALQGLGALLGQAALPAGRVCAAPRSIYREIWAADQAANGVPAILPGERGDPETGYVVVDEQTAGAGADHRLFPQVVIPERKRPSYDLVRALFDNYELNQRATEAQDQTEARETLALLEAVSGSPPMALARAAAQAATGGPLSDDRWQQVLFDLWFRPFDLGRNRDLSGFEHVMVGEANGEAVGGHHFWYRYYLHDGGPAGDRIVWRGTRYDGPGSGSGRLTPLGRSVPEVVTLSYRWRPDGRDLFQEIGGFFVGCSVEGLMALGTARFFDPGPAQVRVGRGRFELVMHKGPDRRSIRTFYPRFVGLA